MAVAAIESEGSAEEAALGALGAVAAARSGLEARLVEAARLVVAVTGAAVLAQKGFVSVEELTDGQRARWRAETKRAACAEVQARLGMGVTQARHLVGLACAPVGVRAVVLGALDRGEVSWEMARAFWRRCGSLEVDGALLVAEGLFGTDAHVVVAERLTPEGELRQGPWHEADYTAALAREATRAEGSDVVAERERRSRAYRERRARITVHDDGTATLEATGPAISLIAAHARVERAARLLRKQGDPRTLDQLRSDVLTAFLVHGRLPVPDDLGSPSEAGPGAPEDHLVADEPGPSGSTASSAAADDEGAPEGWADLVTPDLEAIARVATGMPTVELQVVVPWDALAGRAACSTCAAGTGGVHDAAVRDTSGPIQREDSAHRARPGDPGRYPVDPPRRGDSAYPGAVDSPVGLVLGRHPAYLWPGQVRELSLMPGTTLARLLTDPADGRLVERSVTTYRPDAAMRRQVLAADVFSRAPGTRQPGTVCELDHVTPWGPEGSGGPTAETNLLALGKSAHQLKTLGRALAEVNDLRDLTWTTLLGQTETTRAHDYRQYGHGLRTAAAADRAGPGAQAAPDLQALLDRAAPVDAARGDEHPALRQDLHTRRDLLNRAFYAALAHRGPGAFLTDADDHPGTGEHGGPLSGWMWVTRTATGRRRDGADPTTPTPEAVLGEEGSTAEQTTGAGHAGTGPAAVCRPDPAQGSAQEASTASGAGSEPRRRTADPDPTGWRTPPGDEPPF
ncbi:hypothetical protein [Serinicoccus marinus]|uniref:hypothetical protein n=1 Tax=Serinicoccus marinus TaxID=247333 RepID=UPI002491844C|nr:hypothetical protein [Serinicoccus marinus]